MVLTKYSIFNMIIKQFKYKNMLLVLQICIPTYYTNLCVKIKNLTKKFYPRDFKSNVKNLN